MADVWLDFPSGSPGLYDNDTALMQDGLYAVIGYVGLVEDPDPNVTGRVLFATSGIQDYPRIRKILPAVATRCGIAFRLWQSALDNICFSVMVNSTFGVRQIGITANSSGQIIAKRGNPRDGAIIGTSPLNTLVTNAWQNIEIMVDTSPGGADGNLRVQVEGIPVTELTLLGINSGTDYAQAEIGLTGNGNGQPFYIKDLRIWDGSGGWGTGFPGTSQVVDLGPTGDVSSGWDRTGGATDYEILDNVPPNDAAFISAPNPPPAPSIVTLADLPLNVTSVRSVMPVLRGQKSDGGDGNIQMSLLNGGEQADGADRPMTTAFTYWYDIHHIDPATGNQYTPAGLDSTTLQFNRTI